MPGWFTPEYVKTMMKRCNKCRKIKSKNKFSSNKSRRDKLQSWCKYCVYIYKKTWEKNNQDKVKKYRKTWNVKYGKQYHKKWRKDHPKQTSVKLQKWAKNNRKSLNANYMKYLASKLNQTPVWANLDKIKQIYLDCPNGKQVDHIYPLRGKLVSGFHYEYNLQYLTPKQNQKKGNKLMNPKNIKISTNNPKYNGKIQTKRKPALLKRKGAGK